MAVTISLTSPLSNLAPIGKSPTASICNCNGTSVSECIVLRNVLMVLADHQIS